MLPFNARETVTISDTHYDYILVNRGKSESTGITFHFYHYDDCNEYINCSSVSFYSSHFSFITEVVALGVGYIINPFLVAAELKDTEGVWASKGHLLKPQIEENRGKLPDFDPTLINSITIIACTAIAIYVVWKIVKKRKQFSLPNMPVFESTIITDKEGMSQQRLKRNKPPHNEIRKEIFKLESKLIPPLNRNRGETVEAWLGRINSEEDVNIESHIIINAYNTVRYSNEENTVLLHEFKEEIHKLYMYQKSLKKRKK